MFVQEAKKLISPAAAQTFMRLLDLGRLPNWAVQAADLEAIAAAAAE